MKEACWQHYSTATLLTLPFVHLALIRFYIFINMHESKTEFTLHCSETENYVDLNALITTCL